MMFDMVARGTQAEGATLEIIPIPGHAWCPGCTRETTVTGPDDVCSGLRSLDGRRFRRAGSGRPRTGSTAMKESALQRVQITVEGTVQGVGFRPFVYRLARELELAGWVANTGSGVLIEVEGDTGDIESFLGRLKQEAPASAHDRDDEHEHHSSTRRKVLLHLHVRNPVSGLL